MSSCTCSPAPVCVCTCVTPSSWLPLCATAADPWARCAYLSTASTTSSETPHPTSPPCCSIIYRRTRCVGTTTGVSTASPTVHSGAPASSCVCVCGQQQPAMEQLERCGLVCTTEHLHVEFTSPLAMRYTSKNLFEDRYKSHHAPKSMYELVCSAIALMSPCVLCQITRDRPLTEATLSQQLVPCLYRCTPPGTEIVPQVSCILSSEERIPGECGYYIAGDFQWGSNARRRHRRARSEV